MRREQFSHRAMPGVEVCVPDNQVKFSEGLPAVKELHLRGYNWILFLVTAAHFWNWTRITHLDLPWKYGGNFHLQL